MDALTLSPNLSKLFANNEWVTPHSGATFVVHNPVDGSELCRIPDADAADVDRAVRAAKTAFDAWSSTCARERAQLLRRIAALVLERKPRLARLEAVDSGKPLPEAEWDVDDVAGCFEYYAGQADKLAAGDYEAVELPTKDFVGGVRYEPMGVVAAIIPWNYPLLMATWKVAPALAAGCTLVLKPSELTPLTAFELCDIVREVGLPAGVFNLVTGTGTSTGRPLVEHPLVDKVAFTGSVPTGSYVGSVAGKMIKNVSLELGGKSAAIVFDDADLPRAVEWVMFGCFWTNGQICSSTSRLLVHKRIAEAFLALLVQATREIRVGAPLEAGAQLGPLVSAAQRDKVLAHVRDAQAAGARLLCGGGVPEGRHRGYFVQPTVFADVPLESRLWREEVFGPVLAVRTFETAEEALRLANDSDFGLAAAVFTRDADLMARATRVLRVGIVWQNCSQPCFCQLPWGGTKQSGTGRELGTFGLRSYLEPKQVTAHVAAAPLGWYRCPSLQAKL